MKLGSKRKITYKLVDLICRRNKIGDPGLTSEWCVSSRMIHPSIQHLITILRLCVAWLLLAYGTANVKFFTMKIQTVWILECIVDWILTIIRNKAVSKIVSKIKPMLVHCTPLHIKQTLWFSWNFYFTEFFSDL